MSNSIERINAEDKLNRRRLILEAKLRFLRERIDGIINPIGNSEIFSEAELKELMIFENEVINYIAGLSEEKIKIKLRKIAILIQNEEIDIVDYNDYGLEFDDMESMDDEPDFDDIETMGDEYEGGNIESEEDEFRGEDNDGDPEFLIDVYRAEDYEYDNEDESKYGSKDESIYNSIESIINSVKDGNFELYIEQIINYLKQILFGLYAFNQNRLLEIFAQIPFHPDELIEIFSLDTEVDLDYYDVKNNKDFMVELMKRTGAVNEIAWIISSNVLKEILQDEELIRQILERDIEIPNFLSGSEVITVFIKKLNGNKELVNDKEFMKGLINFFVNLVKNGVVLGECLESTIVEIMESCGESVFGDRGFTEAVLDFCEKTERCHDSGAVFDYSLYDKLLPTEELAQDQQLAERYVSIFSLVGNISKELLRKRDFLEKVLNNGHSDIGEFVRLPVEFSFDIELVKKYLDSSGSFEGINLDFLKFQKSQGVEGLDDYIIEYQNVILNSIFETLRSGVIATGLKDTPDTLAAIEALQKWAEDNDLIKIGQSLNIIRVPEGEIKEGYINIGVGNCNGIRLEKHSVLFEEKIQRWAEDNDLVKIGRKANFQSVRRMLDEENVILPNFDTIVINSNPEYGVMSICEALISLGIDVPERVCATNKSTLVHSIDEVQACTRGIDSLSQLFDTMSQMIEEGKSNVKEKGIGDD